MPRLKLVGNTKQKKKCTRGFPCGYACLQRGKQCKNPLNGQAKTHAEWLKNTAGAVSTSSSTSASIPPGKKTDYAQAWKKSWDNAPNDLKLVLEGIDEPNKGSGTTGGAHFIPSQKAIHMAGAAVDKESDRSTWRHEYGHHLDHEAVAKIGKAKVDEETKKLGFDSLDALYKSADDDIGEFKNNLRQLKKNLGLDPDGIYSSQELYSIVATGDKKRSYISSSDKMFKAFREDEARIVAATTTSINKDRKLIDTELDNYRSRGYIPMLLKKKPQTDDVVTEIARNIRRMKASDENNSEAEATALREFGGKKPKTGKKLQQYEERVSQLKDDIAKRKQGEVLAELPSNSLARRLAEKLPEDISPSTRVDLLSQVQNNPNDPRIIALLADRAYNAGGSADDLLGAITYNKVGMGHLDSYYAQNPRETQGTEAFANLTAYHGISQNDPMVREVLEALAPSSYRAYQDTLNQLAEVLREQRSA